MSAELTRAPARKSLGQHFLFDPVLLARIAAAAGPVSGRTVIEVGPGPGGLTRALLQSGASPVIAIELDARFAEGLEAWPEASTGQLRVVRADALAVNEEALIIDAGGRAPAMIVANLPYNVGTPLLVKWLRASCWRGEMALMFQKEVAQRICAAPGTPHYGRMAVLSQAVMQSHIALDVPPGAFRPPPKVVSSVVSMRPLSPGQTFGDLDALETVTAAAFGQRRKMLRAALKSLPQAQDPSSLLDSAGIDPTRRAETLSQAEFRNLATVWRGLISC